MPYPSNSEQCWLVLEALAGLLGFKAVLTYYSQHMRFNLIGRNV